jgi:hypothetical protein
MPVDSRSSLVARSAFERCRLAWAMRDGTFVLILAMAILLD